MWGGDAGVLGKAEPTEGPLFAAFDLQFWPHAANIDLWTFGPVVVPVCRFARTGDLRTEISSYTFQGFLKARDTALADAGFLFLANPHERSND